MSGMLLDEIQPVWHFRSHHSIVIEAPPQKVAEAMDSFRLDRDASLLVRFFIRARGLSIPDEPTPRETLKATGFSLLAERPGREVVFGIAGKFWAVREMANLCRVPDAPAFMAFDEPGQAKGGIAFLIEPISDHRTLLRTETRVTCSDRRSRLLFAAYWALIRIPSGIIRNDLLRAVARRAEASARPQLRTVG